jgi:hypothetical protein
VTQVQAKSTTNTETDTDADLSPVDASVVRRRLYWWREALYILAFYAVYSLVRNTQGSASVSAAHALDHARQIIHLERVLALYHERWVQREFLSYTHFIEFWNLFYGTFHFVITVVGLLLLFRRFPQRYDLWRNTLACTTLIALLGFALYPLMPPRLLPASYGFVDTLKVLGSLWSFDSGTMHKISNQYAAMPCLHFAWAMWSTLVLVPMLKRPWARAVVMTYPLFTVFAIVVTANHYFLDAAGGAIVLALGFAVATVMTRRLRPVLPRLSTP